MSTATSSMRSSGVGVSSSSLASSMGVVRSPSLKASTCIGGRLPSFMRGSDAARLSFATAKARVSAADDWSIRSGGVRTQLWCLLRGGRWVRRWATEKSGQDILFGRLCLDHGLPVQAGGSAGGESCTLRWLQLRMGTAASTTDSTTSSRAGKGERETEARNTKGGCLCQHCPGLGLVLFGHAWLVRQGIQRLDSQNKVETLGRRLRNHSENLLTRPAIHSYPPQGPGDWT